MFQLPLYLIHWKFPFLNLLNLTANWGCPEIILFERLEEATSRTQSRVTLKMFWADGIKALIGLLICLSSHPVPLVIQGIFALWKQHLFPHHIWWNLLKLSFFFYPIPGIIIFFTKASKYARIKSASTCNIPRKYTYIDNAICGWFESFLKSSCIWHKVFW